MPVEVVETLIIGAGQAGLAMSEHLSMHRLSHIILERHRIAERWRSERWDSLVANGPAWHDRFPTLEFKGIGPDEFPSRDKVVDYFVTFANQIAAPVRCGVDVQELHENAGHGGFRAETSAGVVEARNVVVATGAFQRPLIPSVVPANSATLQLHSNAYRNPQSLPDGAVLVIGAGSSGAQIADELVRANKRVYLSVGPHDRPPRRYRGHDYVWWLGVLGMWDAKTKDPATEHVTIAVSGAYGGQTMDFRRLADRGVTLLGTAGAFENGTLQFAPNLVANIARGDANYLSVLQAADAYVERKNLDLIEEPEAFEIGPDPSCVTDPVLALNLADAGITTIIWATGYRLDFGWVKIDCFDDQGRPKHQRGVSVIPGLYFLGLPWLSRRASSFIWGVWRDAEYLADQIASPR